MYRWELIKQRKEKGLTQEDVARYLGVSRTAYNAYELGTRTPKIEAIIKLKKIFKLKDEIFL